jgi:uncharacterized protein YecE (DUF72 family)
LEAWAGRLAEHASVWKDAFVYFKHEEAGKGPAFAQALLEILTRRGVSVR